MRKLKCAAMGAPIYRQEFDKTIEECVQRAIAKTRSKLERATKDIIATEVPETIRPALLPILRNVDLMRDRYVQTWELCKNLPTDINKFKDHVNNTINSHQKDVNNAQMWIGIVKVIVVIVTSLALIGASSYFSHANIVRSEISEIRQLQQKLSDQVAVDRQRILNLEETIKNLSETLKKHDDRITKAGEGVAGLQPYLRLYEQSFERGPPKSLRRKSSLRRRQRYKDSD
jgi:hypothetical protein